MEDEAIEIEPPPSPQNTKQPPLFLTLGPALTMPLPILLSLIINSQNNMGGGNFMLSTLTSVLTSALLGLTWGLVNTSYSRETAKKDEAFRQEAYVEYKQEIEFNNVTQTLPINDLLSNPENSIFTLNQDGTWLGVSFDDGALYYYYS